MHVCATEAKNKFGQMLDECLHRPANIEKAGRRRSVLMSAAHYDQLVAKPPRAPGAQTPGEKFYAEYKEWVDMQNKRPRKRTSLVEIDGEALAFLPPQAAPVQVRLLKKPIMSLHCRADEMTSAIGAVVSGV